MCITKSDGSKVAQSNYDLVTSFWPNVHMALQQKWKLGCINLGSLHINLACKSTENWQQKEHTVITYSNQQQQYEIMACNSHRLSDLPMPFKRPNISRWASTHFNARLKRQRKTTLSGTLSFILHRTSVPPWNTRRAEHDIASSVEYSSKTSQVPKPGSYLSSNIRSSSPRSRPRTQTWRNPHPKHHRHYLRRTLISVTKMYTWGRCVVGLGTLTVLSSLADAVAKGAAVSCSKLHSTVSLALLRWCCSEGELIAPFVLLIDRLQTFGISSCRERIVQEFREVLW
jgi:hypothetical protein